MSEHALTDWSSCSTWNKHYIIVTWLFRPGQLLLPELLLGISAALHQTDKETGIKFLYCLRSNYCIGIPYKTPIMNYSILSNKSDNRSI